MLRYANRLGANFLVRSSGLLVAAGQIVLLFQDIIRCLFRYPIRLNLLIRQIDFIGAK